VLAEAEVAIAAEKAEDADLPTETTRGL